MKNYLSRKYRITDGLSKKGRTEFVCLNIAFLILFVLSGFAFFSALYYICNMIGSIVCAAPYQALDELIRVLPMIIGFLGSLYVCNVYHKLTFPFDNNERNKLIKVSGIKMIVIGGFICAYIVIGICCNLYHTIIEPGFSMRLFPLLPLIMGLAYILLGVSQVSFISVHKDYQTELYIRERTTRTKSGRFWRSTGFNIIFMVTAFALAALVHGFVGLDLSNNIDPNHSVVPYVISLRLMYLVPLVMVLVYTLVFAPLKKEYKVEFQLIFSAIMTPISLGVVAFYLISLSIYPNAPNVAAFGVLPVDFTASINAFTWIFGLTNVITPIFVLIKAILKTRKVKQAKQINIENNV